MGLVTGSCMGGGFGDGYVNTNRSRTPARTERTDSTEKSSTSGFGSIRWAHSYEIDLPKKQVTSGVLDKLAKKLVANEKHNELDVQKVKVTNVRQLKAEWWKDDCNTLNEKEALRILGYLEAQVKAGLTLKRADWGDESAEKSGSFLILQKPGAAKATVIDVTTFTAGSTGSASYADFDELRNAPGGIFAEINRRSGGNI